MDAGRKRLSYRCVARKSNAKPNSAAGRTAFLCRPNPFSSSSGWRYLKPQRRAAEPPKARSRSRPYPQSPGWSATDAILKNMSKHLCLRAPATRGWRSIEQACCRFLLCSPLLRKLVNAGDLCQPIQRVTDWPAADGNGSVRTAADWASIKLRDAIPALPRT